MRLALVQWLALRSLPFSSQTNGILERRLNELEHNTNFQVAKLDQVTKERIHAERTRCLHRIDRRAMVERVVLFRQNEQCTHQTQPSHECNDGKTPLKSISTVRNVETENNGGSGSTVVRSQGLRNAKDIHSLRPYQTLKIAREAVDASQLSISPTTKFKGVKEDNFSDSAYSSLCPQLSCKDTDKLCKDNLQHTPNFPDQLQVKTKGFEGVELQHLLSKDSPKPNVSGLHNSDCDVTGRVTQELFENVTHAMEDWYERRLKEITEKQQRDMNVKVAELENKVRMLELAQNHQRPPT